MGRDLKGVYSHYNNTKGQKGQKEIPTLSTKNVGKVCKYTVEIDDDKLMITNERRKGYHMQKEDNRSSQNDFRDKRLVDVSLLLLLTFGFVLLSGSPHHHRCHVHA